ncbi:MAG: Crp/Fnr family transcriptional regulator [Bacteroidaceae bacterium]|jgi:cAMP-binding proteins - catabolite gene activator and regulatory subunit of cAMP-dependent protein kinases|nr:Crp/Fnr family transcriptional regulator [Bacteroidaceae bacterium]MBR4338651.1 Crp/Fnr family transcriptional regulator [Bacteroidaceae bacterium]
MTKNEVTPEQAIDYISDLWELLTAEQKALMQKNISVCSYKKHEVIYSERELPERLLCVLEGKVKIYREGIGGRTQIMRMITSVGYFGYRAYFAGERYVTNAKAFEPSVICSFPMHVVEKVVRENNRVAFFFIHRLAYDLGESDARTVNLTQKHIRGRLAENLLFLKENYGLEADGATISVYLSRQDLASLSNMTTANAIRTLSSFASERIIAIDGRKIKIIDEERLRRISKIG